MVEAGKKQAMSRLMVKEKRMLLIGKKVEVFRQQLVKKKKSR